jgi:hypothetical protein
MTFELTRIKQRLADLEKGYKELFIWHDKNKRVFLELNVRSKKRLDFETNLTNSVNQAMQAIIEINERLDALEKKQ